MSLARILTLTVVTVIATYFTVSVYHGLHKLAHDLETLDTQLEKSQW